MNRDAILALVKQYGSAQHEVGRASGRGAGAQERDAKARADVLLYAVEKALAAPLPAPSFKARRPEPGPNDPDTREERDGEK